jgi:hypothetical protein
MFTSRAEFGTFNAAAVRESRLVTIRPFLLFATERGDAWILDPVDHLASPIAETGVPRTVHIVETENASRSAGEAVKKSWARLSSSGMKSRPNDNDSGFTRRSRSPLGSRRSSADDDAVDGQAGSDAASARPAATVCPRRLLWSVCVAGGAAARRAMGLEWSHVVLGSCASERRRDMSGRVGGSFSELCERLCSEIPRYSISSSEMLRESKIEPEPLSSRGCTCK